MNPYFVGILSAFVDPIFHAWANILDNYFSNKLFERLTPLVFFSACVGLLILPIIWFFSPPSLISFRLGAILFLISVIEVFYLYPYFWSLRHADTSVVASLFSLGEIVVPLLAFLLVGERLTALQYAGFFVLIFASVFVTLDIRKMRLNRAFVLMLLVSTILALQSVLLKYVYTQGVGWGSSIVWMTVFQFIVAGACVLFQRSQADFKGSLEKFKSAWLLLIGVEFLSWGGNLAGSYALYLIPASVMKGITSTQPVFVLIYALLFVRVWPNLFREYLGKKDIAKKAISFAVMIAGVLLITRS